MHRLGLRRRALAREPVVGIFLNTGSPTATEICARAGSDWVLLDLEHGLAGEAEIPAHLRSLEGTTAAGVVRVEEGTRLRIGRALDLGAEGIMVPRVESPEQAERVVSWLRLPPAGERGVALFTRGLELGAIAHGDVAAVNDSTLGIIQIESRASAEAAAEIASIDGVDVLFIGPTDLSHALGVPGRLEVESYRKAIGQVGRAAVGAGKAAGVLLWRPEQAPVYADAGFTFFAISSDGSLLDSASRAALGAVREILEA
jgi:2-dehydro-3-deoxyglucarate aldolase/4-hydroxy-2-oxoheptanedioate aldolase